MKAKLGSLFFFLFILVILSACSPFGGVPEVGFRNENVLMPRLKFKLRDSLTSFIEFWPKGKPFFKRRTLPSSGYYQDVTIVNLVQSTEYSYNLVAIRGQDTIRSRTYSFFTGSLPDSIYSISKERIDSTAFEGYVLLRRYFRFGVDLLINSKGEIVWYHKYDRTVSRPISFTSRNSFISIYDTAQIIETDLYGNEIWRLNSQESGSPGHYHHEVFENKDAEIVVLTTDSIRLDLRKYGGEIDQLLLADGIRRLNQKGEVLWRWSLLDNLDFKLIPPKFRFTKVLGHANSVAIDLDGHYLISFRDFDQIWKIDSSTGKVIWKLGKGGHFEMDSTSYFYGQHSVNLTPEGDYIMFDNGHFKLRPSSRVVVIRVDNKTMKAELVDLISLPRELSSYRMSSAYKIGPDRFLTCTTTRNAIIAVVDFSGKLLWKSTGSSASYRALYIKDPFPF